MTMDSILDTRRKGEPDLVLFVTIFILAGIGLAMNYSASAVYAYRTFGDSFFFLKRQILWFVISLGALMVVQGIDYRTYSKYTKMMLLLSLALLVFVLIPGIGHSAKGASRWIGFGSFSVQPSEFVKIFVVIYCVKVFSMEVKENYIFQLLIPMIVLAIIFVLIMMQPDFSTAMNLLFVAVFIFFLSGFPLFYILSLFIISIPMFYLLIYQVSYRRVRLLAYLDPWKDRFGTGYHIIQSFTAFKLGGLLGVGLGFGKQKLSRLPEPHTDFVFAVIAEEAGFLGTLFIAFLFCFFFWRGVVVALNAPDNFGRLLAMGLTLLIVVQAFLNMGVVTGVIPATGIPLPFVSYGGSSLLSAMISAGILLNISRYRERASREVEIDEVWNYE